MKLSVFFTLFNFIYKLDGLQFNNYMKRVPITIYSRDFQNKQLNDIQVFEPDYEIVTDKKQTKCLVFFTGGNSYITYDIYTNILHEIASKNMAVYIPKFKYNNYDKLINELINEYYEVIPMSHSSGSTELFKYFSNKQKIKRMILIDPVDTRFIKTGKINMKNINELLFLNAEKSYSGKPIPFIPDFLKLDEYDLKLNKNCKINTIISDEGGHCDILNPLFSNIMYDFKICDGLDNRKINNINEYHQWVSRQIYDFVYNNTTTIITNNDDEEDDYTDI